MEELRKKAKQFGRMQADVIMEAGHSRYNAIVGKGIVKKCIKMLEEKTSKVKLEETASRNKETRAYVFAKKLTEVAIRAGGLMQDTSMGILIMEECLKVLQERVDEIQPKKADPKYKEARYGKNS